MTELATTNQVTNFLSTIEKAATQDNVDVDKMKALLDMQERVFNKNAEIAFNEAMSKCQSVMPSITRDAQNQQTSSKYAKFESILKVAKPVYTSHGFSLSFGTDNSPIAEHIRVTCEAMHSGGHSKHYFVDLPPDLAGIKGSVNKTAMHATGSTYSYGKRYLLCMIFNIAVADEDDDGNAAGGVTVEAVLEHMAAVRELFGSVSAIKMGILMGELGRASEAWFELSEQEKMILWRAPTKGGIFTTEERSIMKSPEFRSTYHGEDEGKDDD